MAGGRVVSAAAGGYLDAATLTRPTAARPLPQRYDAPIGRICSRIWLFLHDTQETLVAEPSQPYETDRRAHHDVSQTLSSDSACCTKQVNGCCVVLC